MAEDALLMLCFVVVLLGVSFCICSGVGIYLCKDCCANRIREPPSQRRADMEAAEDFGTRRDRSDSVNANTKSVKVARALLPTCKIVQYSNKKLFLSCGRSSRWGNETCAICLDIYVVNDLIAVCPCKHGYHVDCLEQWLRVKNDCPLCKRSVKKEINERTGLLYAII